MWGQNKTRYKLYTLYVIRWIGLVLKTPKTQDRQEIVNRVRIEHVNLRMKLGRSFNWGKIIAMTPG